MQYKGLTARQLGAVNDSACSLIVDPYIGINVPKIYYRPPVKDQFELKRIVQKLVNGKVNDDQALRLLLDSGQAKRKVRQLTEFLSMDEQQIGQYFKLYLTAFRNGQNFTLQPYYDLHQTRSLRVAAARSFKENEFIPALFGVVASTAPTSNGKKSKPASDGGGNGSERPESLLLGPAAFVNHCCEPNAVFRRFKDDKVILKAVRPIGAGDEITVSYGYANNSQSVENNQDDSCECSKCITAKNKSH